ncbi:MAG: electron transfer flavoprotein alpha/ beta subunit [SAR202 cluster bacterium]|nr:electron transfer flavoprotein alpha/ beta subunit [SAR202 cluster bacterium]
MLKIAVCVKWVPVVARMKFDMETKRIVREGVPNEVNSYDQLAVQRAVELKASHGAEVTVITMGPPTAKQGLVICLALGADKAYHIVDPALAGSDTLATARALALALQRDKYDLIMFGYHSVDAETGQVGPEVAELMGLPQVTGVHQLDVLPGDRLRLVRGLDNGEQVVEAGMPVIVSVTEGIAPEVFPGKEALQEAQQKPIADLSARDLSSDLSIFGQAGSPTWVSEIRFVESPRAQQIIDDSVPAAEAAQRVVEFMRGRGLLDIGTRGPRLGSAMAPPTVRPPNGPAVVVLGEVGPHGVLPVTRELLGAAQPVADSIGGHVAALLIGGDHARHYADELAHFGADVVATAVDGSLEHYTTQAYAAVLTKFIETQQPYAVLMPSTVNGRDLAARVAARLQLGLTGDCVGLEVDAEGRLVQLKPAFGGNVVAPILSRTKPYLATVRPGLLPHLHPNEGRQARTLRVPVEHHPNGAVRVIDTQYNVESADALDDAWAVIAVGMGVGGKERIAALEPLRKELNALYITTRDVVEAGWLPRQLQVGLTGKSVAPTLYVGVGVRGDFNHMVGVQRSGTVIAINNNRRAVIFRQADLGIVADWNVFVPALVEALRAARPSR